MVHQVVTITDNSQKKEDVSVTQKNDKEDSEK
jgi:hypothetical protein